MGDEGYYNFDVTNRGSWRVTVVHESLGKRRVITGEDCNVLERMAQVQLAEWKRRAEEKERARQKRIAKAQGLEEAAQRTAEAQQALAELEGVLAHTLTIDDAIDWDSLRDTDPFGETRPVEPVRAPEPRPDAERYKPRLGILGHLLSSRREAAVAEAKALFEREWQEWRQQTDEATRRYEEAVAQWEKERDAFLEAQKERNEHLERRRQEYLKKSPSAIADYCNMVLANSEYPDCLPATFEIEYVPDTMTLIVDYQLPPTEALPRVKEVKYVASRDEFKESLLSDRDANALYDRVVYQITLRTVHELFEADRADALAAVVFNGWVTSLDPGTGQEVTACILSLHTTKEQFATINLARVDPKQCFRTLKGVGSPRLHNLTPVAPLMQISREDRRFIQAHSVVDKLEEGYNLATMPWEEFEHLVRELFEKEFTQSGGEVKVTQASRDGGVDAVAFDPDPIRGGKIVIQAKRYTHTVGVSAVRDLYGTVLNEGATKGILVTTSDYGPDAFEFAKGKPLTLLNGANLLHLLADHGYKARIDLNEARLMGDEQ